MQVQQQLRSVKPSLTWPPALPCPQRLPKRTDVAIPASIMIADYPVAIPARNTPQLEQDFDFAMTVITQTRKLRSDYGLNKQKPLLYVSSTDAGTVRAVMLACLVHRSHRTSRCSPFEHAVARCSNGAATQPPIIRC